MKKINLLSVVLLLVLVAVSCSQDAKYPLDGKVYKEPTTNASVLAGTYIVNDNGNHLLSSSKYYWFCFNSNGTVTASPAYYGGGSAISDDYATGTWSLNGTTMTITLYGKTISGTKVDVEGAGFALKVTAISGLAFGKMSDAQMSQANKNSIVGTWFTTDDYGNNYGFRFDSDGTCYVYSSDKTVFKTTWALSTNGTKIRIGERDDVNIVLSGGYLHYGSLLLQIL